MGSVAILHHPVLALLSAMSASTQAHASATWGSPGPAAGSGWRAHRMSAGSRIAVSTR
jgi:hypothetical protein